MLRLLFILLLSSFFFSICTAQKLEFKKRKGKHLILRNDKKLSKHEALAVMSKIPEATELLNSANKMGDWANVLTISSGLIVGYEISRFFTTKREESNLARLSIGVGLFSIAVPLKTGRKANQKKAVEIYNDTMNFSSLEQEKPELYIASNQNGLSLQLHF